MKVGPLYCSTNSQSAWFRDALLDLPPSCQRVTFRARPQGEPVTDSRTTSVRARKLAESGSFSIFAEGDFGTVQVGDWWQDSLRQVRLPVRRRGHGRVRVRRGGHVQVSSQGDGHRAHTAATTRPMSPCSDVRCSTRPRSASRLRTPASYPSRS